MLCKRLMRQPAKATTQTKKMMPSVAILTRRKTKNERRKGMFVRKKAVKRRI